MREIAKWLIPLVVVPFYIKTADEEWDLFENLSDNSQQHATSSRVGTSRQIGNREMYEVSQNVDLSLNVDALSKKFDQLLALNTLPTNSLNVQGGLPRRIRKGEIQERIEEGGLQGSIEKSMVTNKAIEAPLVAILEQGVEKMVVTPQPLHYQQAIFQDNWQGYNTYPNQCTEAGVKSIEAIQKSQITSIYNIESQINLLARMIAEGALGSSPRNIEQIPREYSEVVTLKSVEEQVSTFSIIVDEEEETDPTLEESTFPKGRRGSTRNNGNVVRQSPNIRRTSSNYK
ncbi:hypothetical protein M9H77_23154 [Catharanthus roseus]|uniref:Uncharacterized protein n=1 Tax=Catharanthus roseus TaxID=4058 RepID=A0ACC0AT75_CATRO|nr:hypothetical protein M9H77_23154 [Catharanthus roseus]